MKTLQLFMCELCNEKYKDKKSAEMCEARHCIPNKIINTKFHADKVRENYPDIVEIRFNNGERIWYHK